MLRGKKNDPTSDRAIHESGRVVVDFMGAVVPRREELHLTVESDLSNVVPFARGHRKSDSEVPAIAAVTDERIAYFPQLAGKRWFAAFVAGSLTVHAGLFTIFHYTESPQASIGIVSVSVDLVLGVDTAAGLTPTPSKSEAERAPAEESTAASEAMLPAPQNVPSVQPAPGPQPELQAQEVPHETRPPERVDEPKPAELKIDDPPRKPQKEIKQTNKDKKIDTRNSRSSVASQSSNGIGQGRSDADSNYRGLVAAHLARHKRYPSEARGRGEQGSTTVSFRIDGSGQVTSVRLVRGSRIASFDQEAQAMVRRASPFPPPPSGRPIIFTVPVSFHLR